MFDVGSGLGAIKSGFEISNAIRQRIKEGKLFPSELLEMLTNLQQNLLDSQAALNEAAEQIRVLNEELSKQNRADELEKDLEYVNDGGFYIRKSERDAGKRIPYCPVCWGKDGKLVPLNPVSNHGFFRCDVHDASHQTQQYDQWLRAQNRQTGSLGNTPWG